MIFENISIKNFRNFENINVTLKNRNIIFGMNDVGKTNFLCALKYVFDMNTRKNCFLETDFYNRNISNPIEIIVKIDISDEDDTDNQKIRAKIKGNIKSNQDCVYIKLIAEFSKKELFGIPTMYWGGDLDDLREMYCKNSFYDLDGIINICYIDAYVDVYAIFKKYFNLSLSDEDIDDQSEIDLISRYYDDINKTISDLNCVKKISSVINEEFKNFSQKNISVSLKSEIGTKRLFSDLVPYICKSDDQKLYPTAGEGIKKLLVYSLYSLLSKYNSDKITIFLIEEPENNLHRSLQISLSKMIFQNNILSYFFITTHSHYILNEMDKLNLIRIYKKEKVECCSYTYNVPDIFNKNRKKLNQSLAEAIFSKKVLLVEGPSELLLFEKVCSEIKPFYEEDGAFILVVGGISFEIYTKVLSSLDIKYFIKTDNDLKGNKNKSTYEVIGFKRVNKLINNKLLPTSDVKESSDEQKKIIYEENKKILDEIRSEFNIYLSKCSLEQDLDEVLPSIIYEYLNRPKNGSVGYLQDSKLYHMFELVQKLTSQDCNTIYEHYNFECLKKFLEC